MNRKFNGVNIQNYHWNNSNSNFLLRRKSQNRNQNRKAKDNLAIFVLNNYIQAHHYRSKNSILALVDALVVIIRVELELHHDTMIWSIQAQLAMSHCDLVYAHNFSIDNLSTTKTLFIFSLQIPLEQISFVEDDLEDPIEAYVQQQHQRILQEHQNRASTPIQNTGPKQYSKSHATLV